MLELVICDDEKMFRSDLKKIISTELQLCGIDYHITEFDRGENLLSSSTEYQIIFLDIEMSGMDGIAAAKKLRSMNSHAEIIFVTSHPDFVFQGYDVRALNYIIKPYNPEKIVEVLHTALDVLNISAEKYYVIERKDGSKRLPLSCIKYFYSEKRMIHVVTTDGHYTFYEKLSSLEGQLPDSFVRIHNRYLIHMKFLQAIKGNNVIVGDETLPVSRSCKSDLSIAFAKYMLQ